MGQACQRYSVSGPKRTVSPEMPFAPDGAATKSPSAWAAVRNDLNRYPAYAARLTERATEVTGESAHRDGNQVNVQLRERSHHRERSDLPQAARLQQAPLGLGAACVERAPLASSW